MLDYLRAIIEATPWLGPGAVVAGAATMPLARPAGRLLHAHAWHAALGLLSVAGIVLLTLTPSATSGVVTGAAGSAPWFCSLHVALPAPVPRVDQSTLNVAMFLPAGLCAALLPVARTRWPAMAVILALPLVVECVQFVGHAELGRSCEAQDAVDNLAGAVLGMALGALLRPALRRVLDPVRPEVTAPEPAAAPSRS